MGRKYLNTVGKTKISSKSDDIGNVQIRIFALPKRDFDDVNGV
jgi:hypothetical protein